MIKKILSAVLTAACALSVCACTPSETSLKEKPEYIGLYASEDGTLMKDGKPFYGFGVNYYSMLNCAFSQKWDVSNSLAALEQLAAYDVKVVRFNIAGFAYSDWDYVTKKEELYFKTLDSLVNKASSLGRGLIPSFFWNQVSLSDYFDEPAGLALRSRETETMKFIASFTEKVTSRYAENPGIYGWEYGNEVGLSASLPNWMDFMPQLPASSKRKNRDMNDKVTYEDYVNAMKLFAEVVSENDPYHRIIGSGDAELRTSAYHLKNSNSWGADSLKEHEEMIEFVNPAPLSAISYHKYPEGGVSAAANPSSVPDYLGIYDDWDGFMEYFVAQGKRLKKPVYLGETGYVYSNATASDKETVLTMDKILGVVQTIADAAVKADLPLTLFWNYDDRPEYNPAQPNDKSSGTEWSWNERWEKGKGILEIIKKSNAAFEKKHAAAE